MASRQISHIRILSNWADHMNNQLNHPSSNTHSKESCLRQGSIYSKIDKLEEALRCYNEALVHGEDFRIHYNIGNLFYRQGKYKNAVLELDKSRRLNDSFGMSVLLMGLSFSRMGNYKAAETCYVRTLEIMPGNRVALTGLALVCIETGRLEKALSIIDRLISADRSNLNVKKLRADILYRLDKYDESAKEIKELVPLNERCRHYHDIARTIPVGVYSDRYGSLDEKICALESIEEKNRGQKIALSLCYLLRGEANRAIDYLFEARKMSCN